MYTSQFFSPFSYRYVMSIKDGGYNAGRDKLYFMATSPFLGDKRGSYGQNISLTLAISLPEVDANTTIDYINDTSGDVILVGNWTTYTLVNALPTLLSENRTTYLVRNVAMELLCNRESLRCVGETSG